GGLVDAEAMANVANPAAAPGMGLRAGRGAEPASAPATALGDLPSEQSYLDIPAFLRRQADGGRPVRPGPTSPANRPAGGGPGQYPCRPAGGVSPGGARLWPAGATGGPFLPRSMSGNDGPNLCANVAK